jgi:hypothetical protein
MPDDTTFELASVQFGAPLQQKMRRFANRRVVVDDGNDPAIGVCHVPSFTTDFGHARDLSLKIKDHLAYHSSDVTSLIEINGSAFSVRPLFIVNAFGWMPLIDVDQSGPDHGRYRSEKLARRSQPCPTP